MRKRRLHLIPRDECGQFTVFSLLVLYLPNFLMIESGIELVLLGINETQAIFPDTSENSVNKLLMKIIVYLPNALNNSE